MVEGLEDEATDTELSETQLGGNPRFEGMMNAAINFFNEFVRGRHP